MSDFISGVSAALSSVQAATEIARLIKSGSNSLEKAEVKLQIADLISNLADVKLEIADLQSILIKKDKYIADLEDSLKTKSNVLWDKPYYWILEGDVKDGPYCQRCYDENNRLIRLQGGERGAWACEVCKGWYKDKNYIQPKPISSSRF